MTLGIAGSPLTRRRSERIPAVDSVDDLRRGLRRAVRSIDPGAR